jgi:hypothetical protein
MVNNSRREFRALIATITILSSLVLGGISGITWHFYNQDTRVSAGLSIVDGRLMSVEANQIALQTQLNQIHMILQQLIPRPSYKLRSDANKE